MKLIHTVFFWLPSEEWTWHGSSKIKFYKQKTISLCIWVDGNSEPINRKTLSLSMFTIETSNEMWVHKMYEIQYILGAYKV